MKYPGILLLLGLASMVQVQAQSPTLWDQVEMEQAGGGLIDFLAGDNKGGFFLASSGGGTFSSATTSDLNDWLNQEWDRSRALRCIAFTPDGNGWIVIMDDGWYIGRRIPKTLVAKLDELYADGRHIELVQFANNGSWVVVYDGWGYYASSGWSTSFVEALSGINNAGSTIKSIAITPSGGWLILYGSNGYSSDGCDRTLINDLNKLNEENHEIRGVFITEYGEYLILYGAGGYSLMGFNEEKTRAYWADYEVPYGNWTQIDAFQIVPEANFRSDNVLTLEQAYIADDGEHGWRAEAAIGMHFYVSDDASNWLRIDGMVSLIGPYHVGYNGDGSWKMEWLDDHGVTYQNFGVLDWDRVANYRYLGIILEEGDHGTEWWAKMASVITGDLFVNDVVLSGYGRIEELKSGRCNILRDRNGSVLWLRSRRVN